MGLSELNLDGKMRPDAVQFVRDALVAILHACHCVNGKHSDKGQYIECNVDLLIADPLIWKVFHMPGICHVTKERVHRGYAEREAYKRNVQLSTVKDTTFKVDHTVETQAARPEARFIHGCGETAPACDPSKFKTDVAKSHVCNRSELSVLNAVSIPSVVAKAHSCFCFNFFVGGPAVTAWSHRLLDGLPWCRKLFEYTVPQTADELSLLTVDSWVFVLEGLFYTWQLAQRTAAQMKLLKRVGFNRMLNTTVQEVKEAFGADSTPVKGPKPQAGPSKQAPSVDPGSAGNAGNASPNTVLMADLDARSAQITVSKVVGRGTDVRLFVGTLVYHRRRTPPIPVVVKYIGNAEFIDEAYMHQAAVGLAPEGVLPLLGWTTNSVLIANMRLPGLPGYEQLKQRGGGILIMPHAQSLRYILQQPLVLLHRVHSQLCPTLLKLTRAGLFHNDLKWDNVVVWQGRLCLIDFGLATWKQDGLNRKGARGGEQNMQAPELRYPDFIGPIGECQLVFTLGSFLLDGFVFDLTRAIGCAPRREYSSEMVGLLTMLKNQPPSHPDRATLSDVWVRGLPLVCDVLAPMLSTSWNDRPRLKDAVRMLGRLYNEWTLLEEQQSKKTTGKEHTANTAAVDKTKPSRRPLQNLNHGIVSTTPLDCFS